MLAVPAAEARGLRFGFGVGIGIGLAAGALAHRAPPYDSNVAARRRAEIHAEEAASRRHEEKAAARKAETKPKPKPEPAPKRTQTAKAKPAKSAPQVAALPKPILIPAAIGPTGGAAALPESPSTQSEPPAEAARAPLPAFGTGRAGQPTTPTAADRAPGSCQKVVQSVGGAFAEPCPE
jgi:hypothetical protein